MRWLLATVAVLACAGCESSGSDAPDSPPAEPGGASAATAAAELVDPPVSWPASERLDREALGQLSPAAAAAVSASRLPVLLPRRHDLLATAVVMTQPRWTAASIRSGGLTLSLHASRAAHRYSHIDPLPGNRPLRGHGGFVGQNRGIWSASWRENGVAYALDVECATLSDPRCRDEVELLALVEDLTYVGGIGAAEVQP